MIQPRLLWRVTSLEARTRMSYRVDFWLNAVVGFVADFGVVYFLWTAVYRESGKSEIGGYGFDGMVFYYLAVLLLGRLVRGREFEGNISGDIYEGTLNRYLILPAGYFQFKYAQRLGMLAPQAVQIALLGGVCVFLLDIPAVMQPTPMRVVMTIAALAVANLLYFLMDCMVHVLAFWADNVWSLDVAKWFMASLLGGYMLPLSVFPPWAVSIMEILPFRFFFDFPARLLLGEIGVVEFGQGLVLALAWCGVFALVGRLLWHRGQLQYTGVGI